ncbi:MAG: alpha-beta hydrolase superfamily lysophospholipase [Salibacteraceae bacterium]|jgi:alpha-beta hydrolase superfamily lysophospholipase
MKLLIYISFIVNVLILVGCKNDVASALLKGEQVEYSFTNADLSERFVDEGLVSQFSLISNNAGSKAKIEALYIGSQDQIKTDTIILYLHGNLPNMNDYWQLTANLANAGGQHNYGVMMFDYRGFGNSEGKSESIEDLVADSEACIAWLQERGLSKERLIVYGYSLGAMPAAHLAANPSILEIEKIVLDAPQTTSTKLLQDATGLGLNGSTVTSFEYNIPLVIEDYNNYLLWIHGMDDKTASFENFKYVYDRYDNPKKSSAELEGIGHSTAIDMGFPAYEKLMLNFIRQ